MHLRNSYQLLLWSNSDSCGRTLVANSPLSPIPPLLPIIIMSITSTLVDHTPLLRIWVLHYYRIQFLLLNLRLQLDAQGLHVTGTQAAVQEARQLINRALDTHSARVVHFANLHKRLKRYGKGQILQIDEALRQQMRTCQIQDTGISVYVYPTSIQHQLVELEILKQFMSRIFLTPEEILKVVCLNLIPLLEDRVDCHVGIQSYGLYLNGQLHAMNECSSLARSKLNKYSIRYLMSEGKSQYNERKAGILRNQLMDSGIFCLYNELVEVLYEDIPALEGYVNKIRRSYGRFLAVLCKEEQISRVNQIEDWVTKSMKGHYAVSSPHKHHRSDQSQGSTQGGEDSSMELDGTKHLTFEMSRLLYKAMNKFPSFKTKINEVAETFCCQIEVKQQILNGRSSWKIQFSFCEYAFSAQQDLDYFLRSIRQRRIKLSLSKLEDPKDLIPSIYTWVETLPELSQVVVDNVWIQGKQLSMDLIVSRDILFSDTRRILSKMVTNKTGEAAHFQQVLRWGYDS